MRRSNSETKPPKKWGFKPNLKNVGKHFFFGCFFLKYATRIVVGRFRAFWYLSLNASKNSQKRAESQGTRSISPLKRSCCFISNQTCDKPGSVSKASLFEWDPLNWRQLLVINNVFPFSLVVLYSLQLAPGGCRNVFAKYRDVSQLSRSIYFKHFQTKYRFPTQFYHFHANLWGNPSCWSSSHIGLQANLYHFHTLNLSHLHRSKISEEGRPGRCPAVD